MIVNTTIPYTSDILENAILSLTKAFPFIRKVTIGKSVLGLPIYCLVFGNGPKEIFYSGAFHANEWIVTPLLLKFIEDFCFAYTTNNSIHGQSALNIFNTTTFYIVPMVNPDGVNLVNNNIPDTSTAYMQARKISSQYPNIPFPSGWKANINGVDLNLQFPAGWENAKTIKYANGFNSFAPRDFVGLKALTEPEALAIYNLTLSHNFKLILAYHTQGKEIYWQFRNYASSKAYFIGQTFAKVSGYTLADVPYESSFAGYKDWFLQEYGNPAYTIEAGIGQSPLSLSQFDKIYKDNLGILVYGATLS